MVANTRSKSSKNLKEIESIDYLGWTSLIFIILITLYALPDTLSPTKIEVNHVWYFGWITAVSTGLGVVPFIFVKELSSFWIGVSNATAGGMMLAASYQLAVEGIFDLESNQSRKILNYDWNTPSIRTLIGVMVGCLFIQLTKFIMDKFGGEDAKVDILSSGKKEDRINLQKIILIIFVMTLHSMSEGIGIGVSFGGGKELGTFISLSLAIHNIPEGLAVALILITRKFSKLRSGLWAIFTSLPQPLMAIPAYLFVEHFRTVLPFGLGFASGAMAFVALCELIVEAVEDTGRYIAYPVVVLAFVGMIFCQEGVRIVSGGIDEL